MATVDEQRRALLARVRRAFSLTDSDAQTVVEALRRGGPLSHALHNQVFAIYYIAYSGQPRTLSEALRLHLVKMRVRSELIVLLTYIDSRYRYFRYVLGEGQTYGELRMATIPPSE